MTSDLEKILQLAQAERKASKAPLWKSNAELACEIHGEACEALYQELYAQLDAREGKHSPVSEAPNKPCPVKALRREALCELRERLPGMIDDVLSDFER